MFPHVGRQVRGHLLQLRGDNQSPRLEQGSSVLASGVERSHPGSREGVGMNLGLPQDGYRTIGLGGAERFDVDFGQRSEHVDDATGAVDYPSEHVGNLSDGRRRDEIALQNVHEHGSGFLPLPNNQLMQVFVGDPSLHAEGTARRRGVGRPHGDPHGSLTRQQLVIGVLLRW